jgi:hypothetical protein
MIMTVVMLYIGIKKGEEPVDITDNNYRNKNKLQPN